MEFQTPEPCPQPASIPATSVMGLDTQKARQGQGGFYFGWALTQTLVMTLSEPDCTRGCGRNPVQDTGLGSRRMQASLKA